MLFSSRKWTPSSAVSGTVKLDTADVAGITDEGCPLAKEQRQAKKDAEVVVFEAITAGERVQTAHGLEATVLCIRDDRYYVQGLTRVYGYEKSELRKIAIEDPVPRRHAAEERLSHLARELQQSAEEERRRKQELTSERTQRVQQVARRQQAQIRERAAGRLVSEVEAQSAEAELKVQQDRQALVSAFLVEHGYKEVDTPRRTWMKTKYPIHTAAKLGDPRLVEMLLAEGANPAQKDSLGKTAAQIAQMTNTKGSHAGVLCALGGA